MLKTVPVYHVRLRAGLLALLLVLGSAAAVYAATLTLFTAAYSGTVVRVEWEVSNEVDVTGFELARKSATDATYSMVSTTAATGQRRYLFLDTNVYRGTATTGTTGGSYTYRLTVRGPNGDQSYLTPLAGTPSAVQRSWGTIKSMFR